MNSQIKDVLQKLAIPLLISGTVFGVFYFGGDTYKSFGLAAVDSTTNVLKYVLGVIAFMSLGVLVNRIIRYVVFEGIIASTTGTQVPKLLTQISGLLIFFITVAACASVVFNQDLTILWAASGVAGLVLGMALRELLQDVFAGIALNIDRSVRLGDYVQIHKGGDDKIVGQLLEVSWRSTHVRDTFGDLISFPNSKFSSFTITNFSMSQKSGRTTTVTIDGRVPTNRAMRILQSAALDALMEVTGAVEHVPTIGIKAIKNDGIEYIVNYESSFTNLNEISWKVQQAIMLHLAKAGLKPVGHKSDDRDVDDGFVMPDKPRLISLLRSTQIFRGLSDDNLQILIEHSRFRFYASGQVVVQSGEAGNELFLVLEGLLRTEGRPIGGKPALSARLRPGDLFDGKASLLGTVHRSTVRAETQSLVYEIGPAGLHELFDRAPPVLEKIAENLTIMHAPSGAPDDEHLERNLQQIRHMFPPRLNYLAQN